jgi:hypothetical protein
MADANKQRSIPGTQWSKELDAQAVSRATKEYLATLDDAAFGAATEVRPKFVSPSDPAAQWTGAMRGPAFFAYADNYLVDVKSGIITGLMSKRCSVRSIMIFAAPTSAWRIARDASTSVKSRHFVTSGRCPLYPKSGHQLSALRCPLCADFVARGAITDAASLPGS